MKTHNPNPELWNKILERKTFDKQLEKNSRKLPIIEPNTEIWGQIEKRLEEPKRPVIWYYIGAAAIAMLILFSGIAYFFPAKVDENKPLLTEKTVSTSPEGSATRKPSNPLSKTSEEITMNELPPSKVAISSPLNREKIVPIEAERMVLSPVQIKKEHTIEEAGIYRPMAVNIKTYHEVKITWEAEKPKSGGSPFGRKEKIQVDEANYPTATIQVKFNKSKN
ncbi:hypothetical protein GCM10027284_04760 [Cyclobacterium sediminis]